MKSIRFLIPIYTLFIISCGSTGESSDHLESHDHEEHTDQDHVGEDAHDHDHNHPEGVIVIEPEDATRLGIVTDSVISGDINHSIAVTGQIMAIPSGQAVISATTSGIVTINESLAPGKKLSAGQRVGRVSAQSVAGGDPNAAARVALNAAKKEVDRLTPLVEVGIVTRREYNAAVAAYESAKAAYSPAAASGALMSPISGVVTAVNVSTGQYVEVGSVIATVAKSDHLLLRLDLPEKYRDCLSKIIDADFRAPQSTDWITVKSLDGSLTDASGVTMPVSSGFIPVYFRFTNKANLAAGTFVEANLILSDKEAGISIPSSALTEQYGNYFVYLRAGDHEYRKQPVTVVSISGPSALISSGLHAGDIVVVKGVSAVKLSESSGVVPEGHTHNH